MKVIIAGSRNLENYLLVVQAMQRCGYDITEVVSGCATGVDTLGERWARSNNLPIKEMPANWNRDGSAAGPIRNRKMAENAEALIALWDGKSRGTKNMIETAQKLGLMVYVKMV